ncbi:response regulator [Pseudodesulfovibrio senegalensis]|uniref:Response regulator n=1 Tax=Pseudodesulfovibrio senegalensis TaxID=1721087 RepID=A0A6N6N4E5_9BACT|nr:response regulator [Pseudodesulfovibrio senegalensis]KAB1441564.1 response regulator [Pseudodesulfovibrio senegalensis]
MQKILVIDDEKPTLKMFGLLLGALGYETLTAENGREGVDAFREHRPEIVLTDIKMPIMDGIEALREIKRIDPHAEVVIITGHGDMELAIEALNLDATDFINKPVQRQTLAQALERAKQRLALSRNEQTQIAVEQDGDTVVLALRGNLTGLSEKALRNGFEQAANKGGKAMKLRFDANASINGAGISALAELLTGYCESGGQVAVEGLSDNFRTVFDMVGISRLVRYIS